MRAYLKLELKRSILSIRTFIGIIIIFAVPLISYLDTIQFNHPGADGVDYFLRIIDGYLCFLTPIISMMYCTTIVKDKKSGFLNKLLDIIDIKTYINGKLIVNTLVNLFIFIIGYGSWLIFLLIRYGLNDKNTDLSHNGYYLISSFHGIYDSSKLAYAILVIFTIALSAIGFSILMFGITSLSKNRCVPYLAAIFILVFTSIIMDVYGMNTVLDFSLLRQFDVINGRNSYFGFILYDVIAALIGYLLLLKSKKSLCK